jgi:glycerol uptake facilitator-like aquaporin
VVRKIDIVDAVIYWLVQLAGGVAGALVVKLLLVDEGRASHYGATSVSSLLSGKDLPGLLAEVIGTFVLVWAIMGTAVNPRGDRSWAGWVIGTALGLGVMVLGPLSGAGFNPARWFGPALVGKHFADSWIYIVGPLLGGIGAALAYTFVAIRPQDREGLRPIDTLP